MMVLRDFLSSKSNPFLRGEYINDAIRVEMYTPQQALIHLMPLTKKGMTPFQKQKMFVEGLHLLALRIEKDIEMGNRKFSTAERVNAVSWAIRKNPKIMTNFKFTVDTEEKDSIGNDLIEDYEKRRPKWVSPEMRDVKPLYAFMLRKDFTDRYGSNRTKRSKGVQ